MKQRNPFAEPAIGTLFHDNCYEYCYGMRYVYKVARKKGDTFCGKGFWSNSKLHGWGVRIIDDTFVKNYNSGIFGSYSYPPFLRSIDGYDVLSTSYLYSFHKGCLTLSDQIDTSRVVDMQCMFFRNEADSLNLSMLNTKSVKNMSFMFSLVNIGGDLDLSGFDTENVANMRAMFYRAYIGGNLNMSNFNTSNVKNMSYMFDSCNIEAIDASSFNTEKVLTMIQMFCSTSACDINVSSFHPIRCKAFRYMFSMTNINKLDLSKFATPSAVNMANMFSDTKIETLDLSAFDTRRVNDMFGMFTGCTASTIDTHSFKSSGTLQNIGYMLSNTQNLTAIDLSGIVFGPTLHYNSFCQGELHPVGRTLTICINDDAHTVSLFQKMKTSFFKSADVTFVVKAKPADGETMRVNGIEYKFNYIWNGFVWEYRDMSLWGFRVFPNINGTPDICDNLSGFSVIDADKQT